MNRRRVGLSALVVGAGAAAWRRMQTRVDPGVGVQADAPEWADTSDVSLGDPHIGDPEIALPQATQPEVSLAETTQPDGSIPAIVLPDMDRAGTQSVPTSSRETQVGAAHANVIAPEEAPTEQPLIGEAAISATSVKDPIVEESLMTGSAPTPPSPQSPPLPGDAPGELRQPFHKAHRVWTIVGSIFVGLAIAAVIAGAVIRLPYYSIEPGAIYDTIERVEAPAELETVPQGDIGFVTVAQTANITPWQWLDAKLDNNVRIRHEDEVRGDQTADELREADIRRMQVSKSSAVVVALEKLGYDLIVTPIGIEVSQVFDCTAADGTLGTGDLIVGVNGIEVLTGEQLVAQLMEQSIGDEVDLLVERIDPNNPTQSMRTDLVAITLGSADAACLPDEIRAEEPRPFIGIGTLPIFDEDLPVDVDLRTGRVSGPSAGLAFTLAIMDVLSEGELTNGLNVVATGSIDRDGNVGPVGGIHQKTVTAERSGADVFIVPRCCDNFVDRTTGEPLGIPGNYEEALLYADDIIVIGVDTLDEALIALGELGGDVDQFLDQDES